MTKKPANKTKLISLYNLEKKATAAAKAEEKSLSHWISCLIARAVGEPDPVQQRGFASAGPRLRKQLAKKGQAALQQKREASE